ncbi:MULTISPECIES: hypothetical protein [Streptomyces]|uniref:Uncharacterized protein n=2 Tax=Streptomyces rimosus subsp. rimosus TaxID=132474 RepID=L8EM12_STRR1|nr:MULTISPECIES: hypothetical protein [Streptomyces]KOG76785.1 hypothetical protein ADK78_09570 [Kitasatospora aureofaciens]MYT47690.1 hypothetical protein [Streptomyces sp. SID5471]KEF07419.1 hypothetical protein DF17_11010 [Streptomyces rimosus]KEF19733.1 hypothetical protein DF18_16890 [Streptomyces rimosus]KOT45103.1 hypothetical protein ADK42_03780 [Streptomyces rimosus subsp. rimosus]
MSIRTVEPGDAREHTGLWLLDCVLRYFAVFSAGWVVVWATLPGSRAHTLYSLLFGDVWLFAFFGGPSMFILMTLAMRRTLREQDEFRVVAGLLWMIPMPPLLFAGFGWGFFVFPAVQLLFVWGLLPLPTRCVLAAVEPGRERERQRWAEG